jgi:hypothetical protein
VSRISNGNLIAAAAGAIVLWTVLCSAAWFIETRDDYARLAIASACFTSASRTPRGDPQCEAVKPADLVVYKANIDRKARISRIAGAFGGMVAVSCLIIVNQRRRRSADA